MHLRERVLAAEERKLPVREILEILEVTWELQQDSLLGEKGSPSNQELQNSLLGEKGSPSNQEVQNSLLGDKSSPSKSRRCRGEGSGSLHWKLCKRRDKSTGHLIGEYLQPWYHYEIWRSGDRLVKGTAYIPQRLLGEVQRLEDVKAPVSEILEVLGVSVG